MPILDREAGKHVPGKSHSAKLDRNAVAAVVIPAKWKEYRQVPFAQLGRDERLESETDAHHVPAQRYCHHGLLRHPNYADNLFSTLKIKIHLHWPCFSSASRR